nr:integrase, catalytic region, zinc finger, CCHC-type, peptidase aspartic, catalytic [Tanacetum cinerariifolium]
DDDSIDNGPLVYPTVEENGQTRLKKYSKLTKEQKLQDDCDVQATNTILHDLPPDVYAFVNHQEAAKAIWDKLNLLMKALDYHIKNVNANSKAFCTIFVLTIVAGAENRPPMLKKSMYDSWASRIRLFIKGKKHGRMMLDSIDNGPLVYPAVEENGQTRLKKDDNAASLSQYQVCECSSTGMKQQREDPIECVNKVMEFLSVVASRHMVRQCTQAKRPRNATWFKEKAMLAEAQEMTIPHNAAFQTEDLDAYDSDCDDLSSAKAVLMANLLSCDSDVLSETKNAKLEAFKQEIDTLKETLSNNIKEKESLSTTLNVFKTESKEKESNLGYQNPFHLKKAQRIKPTLYDGSVIAKEQTMISVIDDEETLILEEENVEQAFWLKHSNHPSVTPAVSHTPVKVEAPHELPKEIMHIAMKSVDILDMRIISKHSGNITNNRISQASSSNKTNKVEAPSRSVKSSKNKKNCVDKTKCNAHVMQSMLNANSISESVSNALVKHSVKNAKSESLCAICNKCLFDANHAMCLINCMNDRILGSKAKSEKNKKRKVWKPTGKVFNKIGYSWKPTGRTFTIVGNRCPLTRITSTKIVPLKESTIALVITLTQGILVYSRRPKTSRSIGSCKNELILIGLVCKD